VNFHAVSQLFGDLDRELWLITARAGDGQGGLIATLVLRASLVPELPRVIIGLAKHHHTHELVERSGAFAMHLIGEENLEWVWRFGLRSGRESDKLSGLMIRSGATGSPILMGVPAWLDCRVETSMDTGDRTIFLAEVVDAHVDQLGPLLTRNHLMKYASAEKLGDMDEAVARDIEIDRQTIIAWRQRQ